MKYISQVHTISKTQGSVKANLPLRTFVLCFISKKNECLFSDEPFAFCECFYILPMLSWKTQCLVILDNKLYQHICYFFITKILCMNCFVEEIFSLILKVGKQPSKIAIHFSFNLRS